MSVRAIPEPAVARLRDYGLSLKQEGIDPNKLMGLLKNADPRIDEAERGHGVLDPRDTEWYGHRVRLLHSKMFPAGVAILKRVHGEKAGTLIRRANEKVDKYNSTHDSPLYDLSMIESYAVTDYIAVMPVVKGVDLMHLYRFADRKRCIRPRRELDKNGIRDGEIYQVLHELDQGGINPNDVMYAGLKGNKMQLIHLVDENFEGRKNGRPYQPIPTRVIQSLRRFAEDNQDSSQVTFTQLAFRRVGRLLGDRISQTIGRAAIDLGLGLIPATGAQMISVFEHMPAADKRVESEGVQINHFTSADEYGRIKSFDVKRNFPDIDVVLKRVKEGDSIGVIKAVRRAVRDFNMQNKDLDFDLLEPHAYPITDEILLMSATTSLTLDELIDEKRPLARVIRNNLVLDGWGRSRLSHCARTLETGFKPVFEGVELNYGTDKFMFAGMMDKRPQFVPSVGI